MIVTTSLGVVEFIGMGDTLRFDLGNCTTVPPECMLVLFLIEESFISLSALGENCVTVPPDEYLCGSICSWRSITSKSPPNSCKLGCCDRRGSISCGIINRFRGGASSFDTWDTIVFGTSDVPLLLKVSLLQLWKSTSRVLPSKGPGDGRGFCTTSTILATTGGVT